MRELRNPAGSRMSDCDNRQHLTDGRRSAEASKQMVEHVARDGRVIEIVTRAEIRAKSLRHRSVYVAVLDHEDQLWSTDVPIEDVFPGAWDLAFGGVCDVGEGWAEAAERELFEEAGIKTTLRDCGPVAYEAPDMSLIGRLYCCRHDGPFAFDDAK